MVVVAMYKSTYKLGRPCEKMKNEFWEWGKLSAIGEMNPYSFMKDLEPILNV